MFRNRTIGLVAIMLGILAICLSTGVLANGTKPPSEGEERETTTPPAGRGPAEAAAAISIAPISVIQQRGHVNNACEAQVMMMRDIKERGGEQTVGDYRVAYILDPPMGSYQVRDGRLTWVPPAACDTQQIEVVIMDSLTGKPLPMSPVTVDVVDQSGNVVQSQQLAYYWGPMDDHYASNFSTPTAGAYSLKVRAPAPNFRRHDRQLGCRFSSPLDATFTNVKISPKAPMATETSFTTPPSGAGPTQPETPTTPPSDPGSGSTDKSTEPPSE